MQILSTVAANRPRFFMIWAAIISVLFVVAVAVPSLAPKTVPFLYPLHIDTDPENMLSANEPVRVYHNDRKREFSLNDMIVVGVINNKHDQGVFNVQSLKNVYELTEFAKSISWENEQGKTEGVVSIDLIAPSVVDNIEQAGLGTVRFEWLMKTLPKTEEEALGIAQKASRLPFLDNTLVSGDQKALALYIPITSKNISYRVASELRSKIATFDGNDTYHITGMPVAQDTFGVEMFKQMAMSAPLAMLLIFLLMWLFFKKVTLIVSPMIVAMVSVITTMGLLVVTGNTVHIMSSMIPVFIMPIAVLDAVHILSDFFDRYPKYKDRRKTLEHVMEELSKPMLFTSLTTAAGFGSLAFTPIPPVQVFGIFIAIGVVFAWLFTITLIPAYIMLMSERSLDGFGMAQTEEGAEHKKSILEKILEATGRLTYKGAWPVIVGTLLLGAIAVFGMTKIQINDNPVKWFEESHDIRVADRALNERFAGTYMAYLVIEPETDPSLAVEKTLIARLDDIGTPVALDVRKKLEEQIITLATLKDYVLDLQDKAETDDEWMAIDDLAVEIDNVLSQAQIFKQPDVLRYVEKLQHYLLETGLVGKSNGLPDVIKTVHRELFLGEDDAFRIPDTQNAVAQTLITYQNSHRPDDLWHFTTPDYNKLALWIQLKSGDNKDTSKLVEAVEAFFDQNSAPIVLKHDWFGLTYINVIWQNKMVKGMAEAFAGSFVIVLLMMIFLFRSFWWGLLSMIPLTVTIAFIYGIIGLIGKDYDMPVAVLSSLSLGLAVDYAIHFLARSREMVSTHGSWKDTVGPVFGEPARAIARNVIVIGVGFLPLLAAPLVPYQTVGIFISAILLFAGVATLIILPAMITVMEGLLFKKNKSGASL